MQKSKYKQMVNFGGFLSVYIDPVQILLENERNKKKWKIKLTKRVDQNNTDMISVNERIGCSYDTSVRAINVLAAL